MTPSQKNWPGGQWDQGHVVVLHVQEEVYWLTLTFRRRVAKYHRVSMRCPKFRNYDVSPGIKHKRGVQSRVKKLSVPRDQNSIFFLKVDQIPFLGLDLINPQSSSINQSGQSVNQSAQYQPRILMQNFRIYWYLIIFSPLFVNTLLFPLTFMHSWERNKL